MSNTRKRIYISGKITGLDINIAKDIFDTACFILWNQGYNPINPMTLNHHSHDQSWSSFMRVDIKALCECEAIYMLPNWKDSKGAILEHHIAESLGMEIIFG
jgi:hypothetical protein